MKKILLLSMILLLAMLAESQTFKRITTSQPNYRWQQYNTYEKIVTRCNTSGVVTDTLATMDYARDQVAGFDSQTNDTTTLQAEIPTLSTVDLPSYTTAQVNALTGMIGGSIVYDATLERIKLYIGDAWVIIAIVE